MVFLAPRVEARDAAEHPAKPWESPTIKTDFGPNVSSA